MNVPNLQAQIERRALDKINKEIANLSNDLKYVSKPPIIEGVQVKIGDAYPYLCQIYDCESIRSAIIEHNLPIFIQREIDELFKKP